MSAAHTKGRITFKEDGDANHYSMLTEDGKWWLAILANGEQTSARQAANFRRLAACWNACEGVDTDLLEQNPAPFSELRDERDSLLKVLTELVANQDATWVAAGFTDEQIKVMPYLKPARAAIAKLTGATA